MEIISNNDNAFFEDITVKYLKNIDREKLIELINQNGNRNIDLKEIINQNTDMVIAEKNSEIIGLSTINRKDNELIINEYIAPNLDSSIESSLKLILATSSVSVDQAKNSDRLIEDVMIKININGKNFPLTIENITYIKNKANEVCNKNFIKKEIENNKEKKEERESVINELDENKAEDLHGKNISYLNDVNKNPIVVETEYSNLNDEIKNDQRKAIEEKKDFDAKEAFIKNSEEKVNIELTNLSSVNKNNMSEEEKKVYLAASKLIGNNIKVNVERGIIMEEKNGIAKMNTANYNDNGIVEINEINKEGDKVENKTTTNNISIEVIKGMKENGIDLNDPKYKGKEELICEAYGYKLKPEPNVIKPTTNNHENKNSYVKKLSFKPKNPNSKEAAYIDALVLALITGAFGGIFLMVLVNILN